MPSEPDPGGPPAPSPGGSTTSPPVKPGAAAKGAHYRWWTTFGVEVQRSAEQHSYWTEDGSYIAEATWHGRYVDPFLDLAPSGRNIVQPFVISPRFCGRSDPIPALARLDYRQAA